jgi:hypothetical protein
LLVLCIDGGLQTCFRLFERGETSASQAVISAV